jgi:hypothetical protein
MFLSKGEERGVYQDYLLAFREELPESTGRDHA